MAKPMLYMTAGVAALLTFEAARADAASRAPMPNSADAAIILARGGFRGGPGGGFRPGGGYYGAWRRSYAWPPGGAIAAGAAIGVLSAGAAVGYATVAPPTDGLCWYYTDNTATQGFWDVCQ